MQEKIYTPGVFVWRDLMTPDLEASRHFYAELLNWAIKKTDAPPGIEYSQIYVGERPIGGMMQMGPVGSPARWQRYVSVPDVDAALATAQGLGATVERGAETVPGVGRMAVLRDPQGASINLLRSERGDPALGRPLQGEFCWERLVTPDAQASKAFYTTVIGWKATDVQGAPTSMFVQGEAPAASTAPAPAGSHAVWLSYVMVQSLDASREHAMRLGATVLNERIEIPNVGAITVLRDPLGAQFCLFQAAL